MAVTIPRERGDVRSVRRPTLGTTSRYVALLLLTLLFLYPLFWMFISSLKPSDDIATTPLGLDLGHLSLDNYTSLLAAVPLWVGFKNTVIVVLCKGALTMVFCPLAGFAFAKFRFRGRNLLFALILGTMMLPPIVFLSGGYPAPGGQRGQTRFQRRGPGGIQQRRPRGVVDLSQFLRDPAERESWIQHLRAGSINRQYGPPRVLLLG